ncbi:MAG: T9SS type A sorting domain-containing protein [Bacteroidota bacterium]
MKIYTYLRTLFALAFVMMFAINYSFAQSSNNGSKNAGGKGELVNFNHYWDDGTWTDTDDGLVPKMVATPNPATAESLRVFYAQLRGETQLALFDLSGKKLADGQIGQNNQTTGTYAFNIAHLSAGIYFVRMSSGDFTTTQKVVVR